MRRRKNDPNRYRLSLHGDVKIDTHSNREPTSVVGYEATDAGASGGRVWRIHKNGKRSWLLDTVLADTALAMAEELNETL